MQPLSTVASVTASQQVTVDASCVNGGLQDEQATPIDRCSDALWYEVVVNMLVVLRHACLIATWASSVYAEVMTLHMGSFVPVGDVLVPCEDRILAVRPLRKNLRGN
jgi:hypothetical protein